MLFKEKRNETVLANSTYLRIRHRILVELPKSSNSSLEAFVDHDRLSDKFPYDDYCSVTSAISELDVLVFRCENLDVLTQHPYSPNDDECKLKFVLDERRRALAQDHPVWDHVCPSFEEKSNFQMSYKYAFSKCECILIEAQRAPDEVPRSFWKFPPKRLLATAWNLGHQLGKLRYFILGIAKMGYFGIERDMNFWLVIDGTSKDAADTIG